MRFKRWKQVTAWMLILAMVGSYGNTVLAAGTEVEYSSTSEIEEYEPEDSDGDSEEDLQEEEPQEDESGDESPEEIEQEEELEAVSPVTLASSYDTYWDNPDYANLIVFVDFSDTTHEHTNTSYVSYCTSPETTLQYFNGDSKNPLGMREFLYHISYGQLRVENMMPQYDGEKITTYRLDNTAAYYAEHETELVAEVISQLNNSGTLDGMPLDLDGNDGVLDNLTIVVPCDSGNETRQFGAHQKSYSGSGSLNGALVRKYNIVTEGGVYFSPKRAGQIVHEFLHSLGYPDLYVNQTNTNPVISWDIMSAYDYAGQYPLAYLRSGITKWFDMPTVTTSQQQVSLYAATAATEETKDQQAFILKTDYSDTEFFVVEYRRDGTYDQGYDSKIPGSGLIIYRVNTSVDSNIDGKPWLIYVYRPGDTADDEGENASGDIFSSYLSAESGRTSYGSSDLTKSLADGAITYSDGTNSGIVISNVGSAAGDQITFDITFTENTDDWKTLSKEAEGAETYTSASCMGTDGSLYFLMKKGGYNSNTLYLYKNTEDGFQQLGSAPAGSDHILTEYDGALYTAYRNNNYYVKLAKWNGSSWQELYTSPYKANNISLASDNRGVYLAYSNSDGTRMYAVSCDGTSVTNMGSQAAASSQYLANPSIAAENGTVVLKYREAYNKNKLYIKVYNQTSGSWEDVGSQSFSANSSLVKIHDRKIYLMKNGTTYGDNAAYVYTFDLSSADSQWEQLGNSMYANTSIDQMDLCFSGGEVYLAYASGASPYAVEVKYLQDNEWVNLGGTVAQNVSELGFYAYNGQLYVAYCNQTTHTTYIRTRASESTGSDEMLWESYPDALDYGLISVQNPFFALVERSASGDSSGISLFSRTQYGTSFGEQISDATAQEIYQLMVEQYITNRQAGNKEATLENSITFPAQIVTVNGTKYLVEDDAYEEAREQLGNAFELAFGAFYMDYPEAFWIYGMNMSYAMYYNSGTKQATISEITLVQESEYYEGASKQIEAYDEAVAAVKQLITDRLTEKGEDVTDRYALVKEIHDYLCEKLSYNDKAAEAMSNDDDSDDDDYGYAHTSSTAFLGYNGSYSVVCEGYAKAFKVLCDQFGITSCLVIGQGGTPGSQGPHMWNYVKMEDGQWYGLDATWDDQETKTYTNYFLAGSTTKGFHRYTFSEEHVSDMQITTGAAYPFVYPELAEEAYDSTYWYLEYADTSKHFTSYNALLTALYQSDISSGVTVTIRSEGIKQPSQIPAALFAYCAEKKLNLEISRKDTEKNITYTWKFTGLQAAEAFTDYSMAVSMASSDVSLPAEFRERSYLQVIPEGKIPACESAVLTITQESITAKFADTQELSVWRQNGNTMTLLGQAETDGENGSWISFALKAALQEEQENYVLSTQSRYGWQAVETEDGELHYIYIENRSGKRVTGWQIIDGKQCWFDSEGYLVQGPAKVDGTWYLFGDYADKTQGIRTGYEAYHEQYFYTNASGVIQKGWQKINNIWHYFSAEEADYGVERPSTQSGYWVTMSEKAGDMAGRRYYFKNNTTLLKNWQTVDGKRYLFTTDGYARTGWYPGISEKNAYYFNELGQMQTGYVAVGEGEEETHYFFNSSGVRQYGWQKSENVWHYFQTDASADNYGQELPSVQGEDYWYTMGGSSYYFINNTRLATGWQTISSKRYYFDSLGRMYTDTWKIGSAWYHFRTEEAQKGILGTGLFTDNGKTYYANSSGVLQRGWQKIDGIWRYFDYDTGAEETNTSMGSDYWSVVTTEDSRSIFYFINGTKLATGWQTIEGRRYYFDGNGILQTGFFKVGSNTYYGRETDKLTEYPGEVVTGKQIIQEKEYYFGSNYVMYVGWQKVDGVWCFYSMDSDSPARGQKQEMSEPVTEGSWYWYTVNGERYCFRSNTTLLKGWQTINGQRYYLDPTTGAAAADKTMAIGNYTYCFDKNGVMQKDTIVDGYGYNSNGYRVSGWQKINNEWHYFNASTKNPADWTEVASTRNGYWVTLTGSNETYYFRNNSSMVKGWQTIDGARYYFHASTGVLQKGDTEGLYTLGNNTYYLGQDGVLRYGWIRETEGSVYYANSSGVLLTGWQKIDNLWYYFCRDTKKQDTKAVVGDDYFATATEGGKTYTFYFVNGTSLGKGWQTIQGRRYYFDGNGILQTGFFKVGNYWYYYDEDRTVKTGWWENPDTGNTHYFNANGIAVTGWQTIDGSRYYFDGNGIMQKQRTKIGNTYYFFGPDGKMRTGFVKYCDTTYYFNTSGQMLKGWQTISGQKYYFDSDGVMLTGFQKIGTATYYFDTKIATEGQMMKGEQTIEGSVYYFNTNGVLLYGWQKINNQWRFFDLTTGKELKTEMETSYWTTIYISETETERSYINNGSTVLKGWQTIGGKRYYFDGNGFQWTQEKGWLTVSGQRYYFDSANDNAVYQGFLELKNADDTTSIYYLNGNGQMLKGWQTISGGRYYFDSTTGEAWTGHEKIGNYWYYFDPADNGKMAVGYIQDAKGDSYYYNGSGLRQTGWQKIGTEWKYFDPTGGIGCQVKVGEDYWAEITLQDGTKERAFIRNGSSVLKGWQTINGKRYYFDGNGFQWTQEKGWLTVSGQRYYFDSANDNAVYQGFLELKNTDGTTSTYYLNTNGQALRGWQTIKVDGVSGRYYLDTSTGAIWMGHQKVGNYWYYFDSADHGKMATGYIRDAAGDYYYYNTNGTAITGWQKLKGETNYRYFDGEGNADGSKYGVERKLTVSDPVTVVSGRNTYRYYWYTIQDAACTVNGSRYCFYNNATLLKNRQSIDGKYYWFHSSTGALYTGYFAIGQNRYYSNADGSVYTGFDPADTTSKANIYYYNAYGQRVTGWLNLKNADGTTDTYYMNANGVMLKGICWIGNTRYIFNPENGKLVRDSIVIDGKTYYADTNGILKTGWNRFYENGAYVWRCLSSSTGEYIETAVDSTMPAVSRYTWYRVTENGSSAIYCIYNNSTLLKNYQNIGGKRYYFNAADGQLQKGWFTVSGTACYSDPDTAVITGGFRELQDGDETTNTYYLNTNGVPLKGWQKISNQYYYFNTSGQMLTGWQTIDGAKYYLNASLDNLARGVRVTGNVTIGGAEYYFNGNGVMQYGWFRFYNSTDRNYYWKYFGADGKKIDYNSVSNESPKGESNRSYQWYRVTESGQVNTYCIYNNTTVLKGFYNIGTWRYYFDTASGILQKGSFLYGNVKYYSEPETGAINRSGKQLTEGEGENKALYYYDGNGKIYSGWINLRDADQNLNRYYFQPGSYAAAGGFTRIGNYYYYFDPETKVLQKNASDVMKGVNTSGQEVIYYTGRYEYLLSGWQKVNGTWYYFDETTKEGVQPENKDNWVTLNGKTYYFRNGTSMVKGWQTIAVDGVNGRYYFDGSYVLQKGWFNIGSSRYYTNPETGKAEAGLKTFDGKTYYFDTNGLMRTGWISVKDEAGVTTTYYFNANGIMLKGINWIGNTRYVFDPETGARVTSSVEINGKTYYANGSGVLLTGMQRVYNSSKRAYEYYYYGTDGQRYTGWQTISGNSYYFGTDGVMVTGLQSIDGSTCYFNGSGVMQKGWIRFYENKVYLWRYFGTDGKLIEPLSTTNITPAGESYSAYKWYRIRETAADGTKVTNLYCIYNNTTVLKGFYNIGSWRYAFDSSTGALLKGEFTVGNATYYSNPETGAINRSGLLLIKESGSEETLRYFDGNGKQYSGWVNLRVDNVTNRYYFQSGSGEAASGFTKIGNYYYYFDPDTKGLQKNASGFVRGVNGEGKSVFYYTGRYEYLLSGWQKVNGTWYYFDGSTREGSIPEKAENNWITLNGNTYYFRNGTTLVTGWQTIAVDGTNGRYYFNSSGVLQKGLFAIGSSYYYTNETTGKAEACFKTFNGRTYYFDGNGLRRTGWITVKDEAGVTATYYFNANGEMLKGISWIGNTRYVFDPETGARVTSSVKIDGKTYYANGSGVLLTGLQKVYNSARRAYEYYYYGTDGQRYTGWQTISGNSYYFAEDGVMQTGLLKLTEEDKENVYYLNGSGIMQKGWIRFYENKTYLWRYFGADGRQIEPVSTTDTTPAGQTYSAYKWYQVEENLYCIYNNTTVLKGFYNIGSWRFAFDSSTGALQKGLFSIGTVKYYSDPDTGAINRSGLFYTDKESGDRYYFDGNGKMVTGWLTVKSGDNAGKYYFNNLTGAAYRGGWYYVDNVRYLFDLDGKVRETPVINSVVSNNYKTITVSWQKVAGAKSYVLEYAKNSAFTDAVTLTFENVETVSTEIRNLESGQIYYFRLKYTLPNKEEDGSEESVYSAVKSVTTQGEISATATSASVSTFQLASVSSEEETQQSETGTEIQAEFTVKGRLKSYDQDENYYLVRVDSYTGKILSDPLYTIAKDDGEQEGDSFRFTVEMPLPKEYEDDTNPQTTAVMSRYALAVKSSASGYSVISKSAYVSNPEYVADYQTPYFEADSKKGIQGASPAYTADLGTKQVLLNLDLTSVYKSGSGSDDKNGDFIPYTYKGKTYYFSSLEALQGTVKEYNNGKYGNKISVTLVLLASYQTDYRRELIHPSARSKSSASYYTLNSSTQSGQELYEAMFSYLGEIFGQDDCYVSNWVLGNEVNSCNAWNYKGSLSFAEYVKVYAASFRQLYYGVKATRASSRVFISLDNAWTKAVAGYAGKTVLDTFASYIYAENQDIDWNVAFHPYSAPLTRVDFWNDYSNTSNSVNSAYISMRNLNYLSSYLGTVEQKYGKSSGSIRLILSEQGWTSSKGEYQQAYAIAMAYYIAEFNSRVDAFIIRAEIDDYSEMRAGLSMGLRNLNDTKKTSYYVYKYMDTPTVSAAAGSGSMAFKDYDYTTVNVNDENKPKFRDAQSIVCSTNWKSIISGYDENKLNMMKYAVLE